MSPYSNPYPAPSAAGPVAWITGASGALGRSVAAHFAQSGARVALLAQHEAALQQTVAAWPADWQARALCLPVNLLEPEAVQQACHQVLQRWGRIDVAVHLAGGFTMGQGVHQPGFAAALDHMLDLNVRTVCTAWPLWCPPCWCKAAARWSTWARHPPHRAQHRWGRMPPASRRWRG